jgi:hypothetical protein
MAKRAAAKTIANRPGGGPTRQHSLVWLQGLLCGAVVTLAKARSIVLCSMAASVGPLHTLWATGHTMATATALSGDMRIIGMAWSAAAGGWLLAEICPILVRAVLEALSLSRAARLRAERTRLAEDWGLDQ